MVIFQPLTRLDTALQVRTGNPSGPEADRRFFTEKSTYYAKLDLDRHDDLDNESKAQPIRERRPQKPHSGTHGIGKNTRAFHAADAQPARRVENLWRSPRWKPVNAQTVFQAASLTKPVVAHAALQLVNARKLNLDEPLANLIGRLVPEDDTSASITARHVLCHATGLPNWRRGDLPLRSYFTPGSRFSYSGEGFLYLQSIIEHLTNEPLDELVKRLVLDPLGMDGSSLVWRASFAKNVALPHDSAGRVGPDYMPARANAACSLYTTAIDYGRFLAATMNGDLLTQASARLWMTPHINVPKKRFEALENDPQHIDTDVAWGLGWGLEPGSGSFFHWGANPGSTAFVLGIPQEQAGLVVFMNGNEGLSIIPNIITGAELGKHPALSWLSLPEAS